MEYTGLHYTLKTRYYGWFVSYSHWFGLLLLPIRRLPACGTPCCPTNSLSNAHQVSALVTILQERRSRYLLHILKTCYGRRVYHIPIPISTRLRCQHMVYAVLRIAAHTKVTCWKLLTVILVPSKPSPIWHVYTPICGNASTV